MMRRVIIIPFSVDRAWPVLAGLVLMMSFAGCAATNTAIRAHEVPAMHSLSEFSDDEPLAAAEDPWEGFNRSMYNFNFRFDKYFFLPVVRGYEFITPVFVQEGVSNFFGNIGEVRTLYNALFQLKGKKFLTTLGRFLTNTTIGIGGLFDPATHAGLKKQSEDAGQSLGYWGVGSGPYLVVPVLGPNTLRSAGGFAVDGAIRFVIVDAINPLGNAEDGDEIIAGITALETIDTRHRSTFRYYESGYPFEYEMLRFLYQKYDELQIMK